MAVVKTSANSELFRKLPSMDEVLREAAFASLTANYGHELTAGAARKVLGRVRDEIASGLLDASGVDVALSDLGESVEREIRKSLQYSLRRVINATGVILHTNLGRAPLSEAAIEHIRETGASYSNLEFDVAEGERGKRDVHVDGLFRRLLNDDGWDDSREFSTIVVNNNAAAVLLALNTLADGGEVIVSRGELVEIGGSFRIPDVMTKSGALLREVGTTNRTRVSDYANAISERTRLLLRVHRSNFEISGFTEEAPMAELAALARERKIPFMEDLGSGALFDLRSIGINGEGTVGDSLRAGVNVVTYSGDKLLGGPQAGMLSGAPELIARMRSNSLFRALRVDKLTYAALEATLLAYVRRDHDAMPALRMMRLSKEEIGARADALQKRTAGQKIRCETIDGESLLGGGAAPSSVLPTRLLSVTCEDETADELSSKLRASEPPIIARVEDGCVLLDLRTVFPEQDNAIAAALARICISG